MKNKFLREPVYNLLDQGGGTGDNKGGKEDGTKTGSDQGTDKRPEHIPEKFWKEGKADYENLGKSYIELEGKIGKKGEELLAEAQKTDRATRKVPEKADGYTIPKIEGTDEKALGSHPIIATWRTIAHANGIGQEAFEAGIAQYVKAAAAEAPDNKAETAKLGDNATARIEAAQAWAKRNFQGEEYEAIKRIATDAAGIKTLEKLMKLSFGDENRTDNDNDGGGSGAPTLTIEKLKEMQGDPRYWDHNRRDATFVKEVDEGFQKLYGGNAKKK